jgi:SAM-dependent methyltransferase
MLIIVQTIILIVVLSVAFWQLCLIYAQVLGAPTVYANKKAIIDACNLAGLKKGQTLIDLGCGDGRSLIIAAREFGARGIGIERSPFCYLKSKLNVFLSGQKNIKILFGDFHKFDNEIKKADLVYVYLLNSVLTKIESWLFASIDRNCKIVSLAFDFPNHQPKKIIETKNLGRTTKLRLY